MRNRIIIMVLLSCLSSTAPSRAEDRISDTERQGAESKMSEMKAIFQKMDVPVSFYGKVMDQNHTPVDGAKVELHLLHFSPDSKKLFGEGKILNVQTDRAGLFSVKHEIGRSLYIQGISMPGYEFIMAQNTNRSFQYCEHGVQKPFVAEMDSPVIFRLRKQGDTAFLMHTIDWRCQISVSESGKCKGYDFIREMPVRDFSKLVFNDEPLVCDFKMQATISTNNVTWSVVLSPGDTNGGIIVSEQLLYEAPENGYQSEYAFTQEGKNPMKAKYVYLRSRNPAIYSRLDVEYCSANEKSFHLQGKSVTNPYGDRNLEGEKDMPYEVRKKLTDEAKSAHRQGKRPDKHDLPKLIKEAKDKADKDKPKP